MNPTAVQAEQLVLVGCRVGINEQHLLPSSAMVSARLAAVMLLPSETDAEVMTSVCMGSSMLTNDTFERRVRHASATGDFGCISAPGGSRRTGPESGRGRQVEVSLDVLGGTDGIVQVLHQEGTEHADSGHEDAGEQVALAVGANGLFGSAGDARSAMTTLSVLRVRSTRAFSRLESRLV